MIISGQPQRTREDLLRLLENTPSRCSTCREPSHGQIQCTQCRAEAASTNGPGGGSSETVEDNPMKTIQDVGAGTRTVEATRNRPSDMSTETIVPRAEVRS